MDADAVRERAAEAPGEPGVYRFLHEGDGDTRVLYVGKAVDLRSRIRTYADPRGERIRQMRHRADSLDVAVTDTETQALLLEANLIKRHQPRYNVRLKDDKSYPLVQLTDHPVPRIQITRDPADDATVYGPFTDMGRLQTVVKALRETYGVRGCSDHKYAGRERPCLDYDIGLCSAPCTGEIATDEYANDVSQVERFFEGETGILTQPLRRQMERAVDEHAYERAANLRDRLTAAEALHGEGSEAVRVNQSTPQTTDVLGVALEGDEATVARLHAEDGKLVERERHAMDAPEESYRLNRSIDQPTTETSLPDSGTGADTGAVLAAFIVQYYAERPLPDTLLCSDHPVGEDLVEWLDSEGVALRVPGTGRESTLVDLALKNARTRDSSVDETDALAAALNLERASRIEGFDVSHAGGRDVVGSNVVFVDGEPAKSEYRRKKLDETNDDVANMGSLLAWRAQRAVAGRDERPDPDLLLIDGGTAQLEAATQACTEVSWDVPVVALAKAEETVITTAGPAGLDPDGPAVTLLRRVRDEAHRFALQYHETLRDDVSTVLEDVPGIGPALRTRLLRRFGSVAGVRAASPGELQEVDGVGRETATTLANRLG